MNKSLGWDNLEKSIKSAIILVYFEILLSLFIGFIIEFQDLLRETSNNNNLYLMNRYEHLTQRMPNLPSSIID